MHFKPIVILGCTASGKSDLAEALAVHLGRGGDTGEGREEPRAAIMAVDSMQVYRGMDIGTAKPDAATRRRIPHFMIDVADPWESYSAARFVADARPHLEGTHRPPHSLHDPRTTTHAPRPTCHEPHPLILVAGTILYLRALIDGLFEGPSADESIRAELQARAAREDGGGAAALHAELLQIDPIAAARIHRNDLRRVIRALEVHRLTGTPISTLQTQWNREHPPIEALYIGIRRDKEALSRRINARVKTMIDAGLPAEVDRLRSDPRGFSDEASSAVGYRQLLDHFAGKCSLEEAVEQIKIQTRYLAKMQRTWLKRWPPTAQVHWLEAADTTAGADLLEPALAILDQAGYAR